MLHLALLNFSCHLFSYSCSWLRSSWRTLQSWTLTICLYITPSSTNKRTVDDECSVKSLMKIRKSSGPNTEPWGTPDFTSAASDISPFTTTLCVHPSKNDVIQFCKTLNVYHNFPLLLAVFHVLRYRQPLRSPKLIYQPDHIYSPQKIGHGRLEVTECHRISFS